MAKAYIFFADGFEEIEGLTVVDLLRRAKIDIVMVSVTGSKMITGSHNIKTVADQLFEDTDFDDADMLILPGGKLGTDSLMKHEGLDKLLNQFNKKGRYLAAICAAPSVLGTKGILKGKNATCYPGFEEKLTGAVYQGNDVVSDGNIVTSKGMGTAIDFSLSLIEKLQTREEAVRIAEAIQYRFYK